VTYRDTGSWIKVYDAFGNVLETNYWGDGYRGPVSFTVRAKGLVAEIKSCVVRVGVRLAGDLAEEGDRWITYAVDWVADRGLWDASYKTWLDYTDVTVAHSKRIVVGGPKKVQKSFDAKAYVVSLVTKDDKKLTFEVPGFDAPK
jgi:hypothetical protein